MNKLEAVNFVMMRCGYGPVSALDTGGASFQAHAERFIDEQELLIQSRGGSGWHYNRRRNVEIAPSGGTVQVPVGCLAIDTEGPSARRDVTLLGARLFDLDNNTDVFTETLTYTYVLRYEFECIPPTIRFYVAASAASEFNSAYGHPRRQTRLDQERDVARTKAEQSDGDASDLNVLNTSEALLLRGGRVRLEQGLAVLP